MKYNSKKNKQFYRRVREKLKRRLRSGSSLSHKTLLYYSLDPHFHSKPIEQFDKRKYLRNKIDEELPLYKIKVPKILSFLKAPKKTNEFLDDLKKSLGKISPRNVLVDHSETEHIGLAASWIFDSIVKELKKETRAGNKRFYLKGKVNTNKLVNNFLLAFGFLKEMDINPLQIAAHCDLDYFEKYKLFKFKGNKKETYKKSNAATELTSYLNNCLNHCGKQLTGYGKTELIISFGEIIGNAEEHVPTDRDWHVSACFEKETNYLNFSIISYGISIYESLNSPNSTAREVLDKIQSTVSSHKPVFNKVNEIVDKSKWEETIWNIMALQEGISSKRVETDKEKNTRGQGLMDFIQFITEVKSKSEDADLTLISGNSCIQFDFDKYPMKIKEIDGEPRRIITFNTVDSLDMPHDKKYVYPLSKKFNGTIISGRLKLSDSLKESYKKSGKNKWR
ncbi:hypothetical protein BIY24_05450 [Halobacteriovorax marinus]|uniref:hypothetical protein n=1 Tax=Halobacteriovorax marinus TaxID=97084 RepID=UPI000BC2DD37|nr:hypothetical protein [Halobacteriovorax marinus]ATH07403.1 hypothetical protein BIY24_05450 [Halobacteriovorax marinus]